MVTEREQGVSANTLEQLREGAAEPMLDTEIYDVPGTDCRAVLAALEDAARLRAAIEEGFQGWFRGDDIVGAMYRMRAAARAAESEGHA